MITITWYNAIYILFIIFGLIWVFTRDTHTYGGLFPFSDRDIALFIYICGTIIVTLIFGGIFWW